MRFQNISAYFLLIAFLTACSKDYQAPIVEETYIHRYGVEVPAEEWAVKGQSGKVVTTLKNGVVVTKSLSSGILDGDMTYTYPHSPTLQKVETYHQGELEKVVVYYRSGKPATETIFKGPEDILITKWYESGVPQSREEIINQRLVFGEYFNPSNIQEAQVVDSQGTRVQRDQYGIHKSTDTIQNGMMILCTNYHTNGSPKEITPYKNGVVEGNLKTFLPAGEPSTIENWIGGKKEGITIVFENGEKFAEVPYVSGIKHGVEKRFSDGKNLIEEITWYNNQRHGPSYLYVGDVIRTDWYYQDRLVTERTFDLLDQGRTR